MKVLFVFTGTLPQDVPFEFVLENISLIKRQFKNVDHDLVFQTWSCRRDLHRKLRSLKYNCLLSDHPTITYNPYMISHGHSSQWLQRYGVENQKWYNLPESSKRQIHDILSQIRITSLKDDFPGIYKSISYLGDPRLTRCVQHVALARALNQYKSWIDYDVVVRLRYDTVIGNNFDWFSMIDHAIHTGPVGVGTRYVDKDYLQIKRDIVRADSQQKKIIKQKYCRHLIQQINKLPQISDSTPDEMNDFLTIFTPDDYSPTYSDILYDTEQLLPAEYGWYQVMSYKRSPTSFIGGAGIFRYVVPHASSLPPVSMHNIPLDIMGDHFIGSMSGVTEVRAKQILEKLKRFIDV